MSSEPPAALRVVILNYRTAALTIDCLGSLADQVPSLGPEARAVVVDNGSGDGSADRIAEAIDDRGWSRWSRVVPAGRNGGFSAGNNVGLGPLDGEPEPSHVLLMNSDTLARPGALAELLAASRSRPDAGLIGPRLEWPDATPQISGFRFPNPASELIAAAATGPITRLLGRFDVPIAAPEGPTAVDWLSFACVLIRAEAIREVGPMDEGFFMYYEDVDYCRRARRLGWPSLYWPAARVVHLRGGSAPVKRQQSDRRRVSPYYYESRSRYFAKARGPAGPLLANLGWSLGRLVSMAREALGHKAPHTADRQGLDIWTGWRASSRGTPPLGGQPS